MFLGRIITNSRNIDTVNFVEVTNNKTLLNDGIKTLIIGKKLAEEILGKENIHYLDKNFNENISWTFGKTERRNEFENDLKEFNTSIIKKLNRCVKYVNFNIFTESYSNIKKLLYKLYNDSNIIYVCDNHIYIYNNNIVTGISINDIQYVGIQKSKIISKLKRNTNNTIINNDYFLNSKQKKMINGSKILIPYMFFIENK